MEIKKYPAIKCNQKLWEKEIKPYLLELGLREDDLERNIDYWDINNYLVSNGGETWEDDLYIINIPYNQQLPTEYLRYEVFTVKEFLEGIGTLLSKVYISKKSIADYFKCYPEQLIFID